MVPGESSPSPTDSSARTQIQLFCVARPAIPPQVPPVPQTGSTATGSQAGLVSGGDTLVPVRRNSCCKLTKNTEYRVQYSTVRQAIFSLSMREAVRLSEERASAGYYSEENFFVLIILT